jgi:ADP-ribose pyrophosphatase YjhB (NUDIX family)
LTDPAELLRWAEALAGTARTGMGFTQNLYERERFEEVLRVAAHIRAAALEEGAPADHLERWLGTIGRGVEGYVTPKVAVGAIVGNEGRELLLTQRSDSGEWFYPVGWADIGYSPSEVAIKEVLEETGIEADPVAVIAVLDGLRLGALIPFYSIVFHCRMIGGELQGHPLETLDVGFFGRESLPSPLRAGGRWVDWAFGAIDGDERPVYFDPPRTPPWRSPADD